MQKISGYIYRRGKVYYIAYVDLVGGGVTRESSGSQKKGDAQRLLDQRLEVIRNRAYGFKESNASYLQHFKDFLNLYKEGTWTRTKYVGVLRFFTEFLADKYPTLQYLHEFSQTPKIFDDYRLWLKGALNGYGPSGELKGGKLTPEGKPHKDWTVRGHLKVLKTAFLQAKDWKLISDAPTIDCNIAITDKKPIITLAKDEDFNLFFERCKELKPEYYPHYLLMTIGGLRFGEMCSLTWDCVFLDEGYLVIKSHNDFAPKGRRKKTGQPAERTVPLSDKRAVELLRKLPRSEKHDNVFLRDGNPISPKDKSFRRWIIAIVRGTRLEGMTRNHEFRHTAGQRLANEGVDRGTIAGFLGHSDIRTTEVYIGKPMKPLMEASRKLAGLGRK